MARKVAKLQELEFTVKTTAPLHVGGLLGSVDADLALARDGRGRIYIPGTSIAGPVLAVLKHQETYEYASHVFFRDAFLLEEADAARVEIREGVGIDRRSGAAAYQIKHNREVLPQGTRLRVRVAVESGVPNRIDALRIVAAFRAEGIRLGGGRTRGSGSLVLDGEVTFHEHEVSGRPGILSLLERRAGMPVASSSLGEVDDFEPRASLAFGIGLSARAPVFSKAERDGIAVDALPLTTRREGDRLAFVLPGSGIKGVLRSHAERIVRTVLDLPHLEPLPDSAKEASAAFREALDVPLVCDLFGSARRCGALTVEDCRSEKDVSLAQWRAIEDAGSGTTDAALVSKDLRTKLEGAGLAGFDQGHHVAVERWTGGAADRLLFSTLEPRGLVFKPLRLRLDLERLQGMEPAPEDQREERERAARIRGCAALALLVLLLDELGRGRIPLGYATHRGGGTVETTSLAVKQVGKLSDAHADPTLLELASAVVRAGEKKTVSDLLSGARKGLLEAWTAWLQSDPTSEQHPGEKRRGGEP